MIEAKSITRTLIPDVINILFLPWVIACDWYVTLIEHSSHAPCPSGSEEPMVTSLASFSTIEVKEGLVRLHLEGDTTKRTLPQASTPTSWLSSLQYFWHTKKNIKIGSSRFGKKTKKNGNLFLVFQNLSLLRSLFYVQRVTILIHDK